MKDNILFLYLTTGGGHLSAARALSNYINEHFSDRANAFILDALPEKNKFDRLFIDKGYAFAINHFMPIYSFFYELSRIPLIKTFEEYLTSMKCKKHIADFIIKNNITKVVPLHFLLIKAAKDAIKYTKRENIDIEVVITDPFTPHSLWFYDNKIKLTVFSEKVKERAIKRYRFDEKLITVEPVILNKKFEKILSEKEIIDYKTKLNINNGKKTILLAGGGDGLPKSHKFLKAFIRHNKDYNIIIVCGRNKLLYNRCKKIIDNANRNNILVFGFVDFMYELMNIADIVITKGGPATVMETLILRKPLIITYYIYGQERGNVDFVLQNQLGYFETNPEKVIKICESILLDENLQEKLRTNIEKLNIRNGTADICKHLLNINC